MNGRIKLFATVAVAATLGAVAVVGARAVGVIEPVSHQTYDLAEDVTTNGKQFRPVAGLTVDSLAAGTFEVGAQMTAGKARFRVKVGDVVIEPTGGVTFSSPGAQSFRFSSFENAFNCLPATVEWRKVGKARASAALATFSSVDQAACG